MKSFQPPKKSKTLDNDVTRGNIDVTRGNIVVNNTDIVVNGVDSVVNNRFLTQFAQQKEKPKQNP